VLAVLRDDQLQPYFSPGIGHLVRDDRVVVVRPAEDVPWAQKVVEDEE
jgi:voltage-gated potassium channel